MNRIAPASPIVDLSHGVPPLDVRGGAVLLVDSLPYIGADAILLAIVDRASDATATSRSSRTTAGSSSLPTTGFSRRLGRPWWGSSRRRDQPRPTSS
jgi:hypothetical protein